MLLWPLIKKAPKGWPISSDRNVTKRSAGKPHLNNTCSLSSLYVLRLKQPPAIVASLGAHESEAQGKGAFVPGSTLAQARKAANDRAQTGMDCVGADI